MSCGKVNAAQSMPYSQYGIITAAYRSRQRTQILPCPSPNTLFPGFTFHSAHWTNYMRPPVKNLSNDSCMDGRSPQSTMLDQGEAHYRGHLHLKFKMAQSWLSDGNMTNTNEWSTGQLRFVSQSRRAPVCAVGVGMSELLRHSSKKSSHDRI